MDFTALNINASALKAQRLRMDVIASNLANINTTRGPDGTTGAYKRKEVVFAPLLNQAMTGHINKNGHYGVNSPGNIDLSPSMSGIQFSPDGTPLLKGGVTVNDGKPLQGVEVVDIAEDTKTPTKMVYNPGHPDANEQGYVEMPNINVVTEMVDMISATRAYEANMSAVQNFKSMFKATIQI
jgi:flagellar basal-body rod protein FlgC